MKFKLGTPAEVWSSMSRAWTVEPTSKRIVEDISKLETVLHKIIDKKGCVVPDEFLRTGRRARSANDTFDLKGKSRKRNRKANLQGIFLYHPDCQKGLDLIEDEAKKFVADCAILDAESDIIRHKDKRADAVGEDHDDEVEEFEEELIE